MKRRLRDTQAELLHSTKRGIHAAEKYGQTVKALHAINKTLLSENETKDKTIASLEVANRKCRTHTELYKLRCEGPPSPAPAQRTEPRPATPPAVPFPISVTWNLSSENHTLPLSPTPDD